MKDKVVVVTGASSGIGKACALKFALDGANVAAIGRNGEALEALRNDSSANSGIISIYTADLSETEQIERVASEIVSDYGRIDTLVNAAGIIGNGTIESTSAEEFDAMMHINLRQVFLLTQICTPYLIQAKGSIVNVSSVAGTRAFPNLLAYCVSKAAVDQFTRCVSLDLAEKGVRVNAVNPGVVISNLHRRGGMEQAAYENFLEHSKATHPLGRVGTPEEVAGLIHFLASDQAGWITGATYNIDGGRAETCAR